MIALTLSLEISSIRLIEFSNKKGRLIAQREEIRFFSKAASHRQVLPQEIKAALQQIKNLWGLSSYRNPLHCILSSDFALLRVATFEQNSHFIPTATLVQRDAQQFLPLPLEQLSIAYQEMSHMKHPSSKNVAYAAMQTDFLEAIIESIRGAGFSIQKMSLLPLALGCLKNSASEGSLFSSYLPLIKETLVIDLADQSLNFLMLSPKKNRCSASFNYFGNFSSAFCEQERGLPLLLIAYLKQKIKPLIQAKAFLASCWILQAHTPETKTSPLTLFLKQEFSIQSVVIDPCFLLAGAYKESLMTMLLNKVRLPSLLNHKACPLMLTKKSLWKRFLRKNQCYISSVNQFTAPSIAQFQKKQCSLLLIYTIAFFILLFSPLSLLCDYVANKKITQATLKAAICLKERQRELAQLRREIEKLADTENSEKQLEELQAAHCKWPLLINTLQKCAPPHGIWITQLTPISKEAKKTKTLGEIISLEIKGLYLEGMNGEQLAHHYADKLANSTLFLSTEKEKSIFSCSKEDGTAYAYPFTLQLLLSSPIRQ